jgi:hypothetical protein
MENMFCMQLVSKNQSLRGNLFTNSFPRNGPHVNILQNIKNIQYNIFSF